MITGNVLLLIRVLDHCSLVVALHDVVHLLQLVGQPLLAAELVLLQSQDQLLIVLHSVAENRNLITFLMDLFMYSACK